MLITTLIQKALRIVSNRSATIKKGKTIIARSQQLKQKTTTLYHEIAADGIHRDDMKKIQDEWGSLINEATTLVYEAKELGEKTTDQTAIDIALLEKQKP